MTAQSESEDPDWRQGDVLTTEGARALALTHPDGAEIAVVVISHDCDIVQKAAVEPVVEVIVGRKIEKINGNFAHAKSARRCICR